ncbi:MAG: glycosyltransferase [Oscillospiraceae bacterium]|nr:glycosyltransferase [Oscillospiraceae bacterium]
MRIVQINETCGTGSIGRLSLELSEYAENKGHTVLFAHSSKSGGFHNSYRIGNTLDHKLHALLSRLTGLQGYFSFLSTKRFIRRMKEFKPDIVHLENLHSNYINLPLLFKYLADEKIATVITLHDCWFFTGKCTYFVPAGCEKWQSSCGKCPLLHIDNVNRTYFFDRTKKCLRDKKKWYDGVEKLLAVGVSEWITKEAEKSILSGHRLVKINNWADRDIFKPRGSSVKERFGIENKKMVLMVSANLSEKKGYGVMLKLSEALDDSYRIVVVGRNISKLDIPENVIHIDHTDNAEQLAEYYSAADVCVNTTKYETFGMVTAEAISCGTPVIVYNNTASPELVGEGCGIVVEEEDGVGAVVRAIERITSEGKEKYRRSCEEYSAKAFSKEKQLDAYMEVYKSLLEG